MKRKLKRIEATDETLKSLSESNILETRFGKEKLQTFLLSDLTHLYFYYYNCESVDDSGWGCAWRSLQSALRFQLSLNNQKKDISFYTLFTKYGNKSTLIEIYKKMNKDKEDINNIVDILTKKNFAPHDNSSGWAEPFISQLTLYDFGFKGDLILVNDYPKRSYAPKEVFEKTVDFVAFKEILKQHFEQKNPGPIILDDSQVSIAVIGIKFNTNNIIELIIMDPHANTQPEIGFYIITLDENGKGLEINPPNYVLASWKIYFNENKPWMVYIPKNN